MTGICLLLRRRIVKGMSSSNEVCETGLLGWVYPGGSNCYLCWIILIDIGVWEREETAEWVEGSEGLWVF